MRYKLPQLKLSVELEQLALKKIKEQNIHIERAKKRIVAQIALVTRLIKKDGLPDYLVLKKLKGNMGSGVFLHPNAEPIHRGEVIAPYSGVVFLSRQNDGRDSDYVFSLIADLKLSKEEQKHFDPKARFHPGRLYSLDLDAENEGNFTRFINHSNQPNVEADFLKIPKNSLGVQASPFEVVYMAKKRILPGEQLLVCYEGEEKSYWGALGLKPTPVTPRTYRIDRSLNLIS